MSYNLFAHTSYIFRTPTAVVKRLVKVASIGDTNSLKLVKETKLLELSFQNSEEIYDGHALLINR